MGRAREIGEEPRAWSLALIPFPFPFERLSRRLSLQARSEKPGKGKEKKQDRGERKEEKRKTVMVALLLSTLAEKTVGRKNEVHLIGDNVLKNPARRTVDKINENFKIQSWARV